MPKASDLSLVPPHLALWHAYDSASKTELYSTALALPASRLLLIDPIDLDQDPEHELGQLGRPAAIVITNGNHWRASRAWAAQFQIPIFTAVAEPDVQAAASVTDHFPNVSIIRIEGAPPRR